jgi:hypothetical protein
MTIRSGFLVATVAALALATAHLSAHDFWLAASSWSPDPGSPFGISAGVGEHFPKREDFKTPANWFDDWRIIGPSAAVPVPKVFERRELAMVADVTLPATGAFLAVMRVAPRIIEMKADEFNDYLRDEGLTEALAERRSAGESDRPAKERYSRYAKLAIRNGEGSAAHLTRAVGVKAELVPATDPTSVRAGQTLTVQLLVNGRPVPNAAVSAAVDGGEIPRQTDAQGRATLPIDRDGAWLVKTVHMTRLPKSFPPGPEWESFWVTLAFHTAK